MIKIFLDGASIEDVKNFPNVDGYTTNPSLIKATGITDYIGFAKELLKYTDDKPVSLEVLHRDRIAEEVDILSKLSQSVYVKIPIDGYKNVDLIQELNAKGYKINATAVFTTHQVIQLMNGITSNIPMIISIFAGRIADTGVNPSSIINNAYQIVKDNTNVEILWASTREVLNISQAEISGSNIITVTNDILKKYELLKNKDLLDYSVETADQFYRDAESLFL